MAKILAIEDDVDLTTLLKKRLKDAGHEPIIANDATAGLRLARDAKPDLIFLDLKLPTGGGLSLLKTLKTTPATKDIPVIVLTGLRSDEMKEKTLKDGAELYMEKPYDPGVLMAAIRDVLANKKNRPDRQET
jgi:DNA-binding response OmpR family regulator